MCLFNFSGDFVHAGVDRDGAYSDLFYGVRRQQIRDVELYPYSFAWLLRD